MTGSVVTDGGKHLRVPPLEECRRQAPVGADGLERVEVGISECHGAPVVVTRDESEERLVPVEDGPCALFH
ncbi:MAG: hypothetical protein RL199_1432 [Pseudomonadota bacterium]|jgi:hypothetical protein